jgi:Flp pilus assembly protein TadG
MSRPVNHEKRQRGTTTVEAAIIMMLFLTFLFGVLEVGRFISTEQTLTNAAREGARLAIAPLSGTNQLPTDGEINAKVQEYLAANRISGATITVERPILVSTPPVMTSYTRVRVENQYQVMTVPWFDMLEINLKGEALMRNETSD